MARPWPMHINARATSSSGQPWTAVITSSPAATATYAPRSTRRSPYVRTTGPTRPPCTALTTSPMNAKAHAAARSSNPRRTSVKTAKVPSKAENASVARNVTATTRGSRPPATCARPRCRCGRVSRRGTGVRRHAGRRRRGGRGGARLGEADDGRDGVGCGDRGGHVERGAPPAQPRRQATDGRPDGEADAERRAEQAHEAGPLLGWREVGDRGLGHGGAGARRAVEQPGEVEDPRGRRDRRQQRADGRADERGDDQRLAAVAVRQAAHRAAGDELTEREGGEQDAQREALEPEAVAGEQRQDGHRDPEPDEIEHDRGPDHPEAAGQRGALGRAGGAAHLRMGRPRRRRGTARRP